MYRNAWQPGGRCIFLLTIHSLDNFCSGRESNLEQVFARVSSDDLVVIMEDDGTYRECDYELWGLHDP